MTISLEHRELFRASLVRVVEARRIASLEPDFNSFFLKNERNQHSEIEMKGMRFLLAMCNYDDATAADSLDMRWRAWMQNKHA